MENIKVKITNWEKHQAYSDGRVLKWFKFQTAYFTDQKILILDGDCKLIFVFLLCESARNPGSELFIQKAYIEKILDYKFKDFINHVGHLNDVGLVTLINSEQTLINSDIEKRREEKRREEYTEPSVPLTQCDINKICQVFSTASLPASPPVVPAPPPLFDEAWKLYPRKEGKQEAIKRFKRINPSEDLLTAIKNYSAHCRKLKTEEKYIKLFSSFLGTKESQPWIDWVKREAKNVPVIQIRDTEEIKNKLLKEAFDAYEAANDKNI